MIPATAFSQEAQTDEVAEAVAPEASKAAEADTQEQAQPAEAYPMNTAEPVAETAEAAPPQATATGAGSVSSIPAPPEGKGQIVFFRDKKFTGGAISFIVREEEAELGKLSNGTWFVHVAEPGAHAYTVHSEAKDVLNLEVEAGETYYVSSSISMGVLAGRPNLSPSDQAAFDKVAGGLKPSKPLKK